MNDDGPNSKLSVVPSEKDLGVTVWITSKPDFYYNVTKCLLKLWNPQG